MSIVKKEAYFKSSDGIHMIRTRIWEDDEVEKIAVFQIAHGVSEHIERYDDFASFLAKNGFVVCGNDHLGHGKSVLSEDELGSISADDGYIRIVDDMHILTNIMKKRYPALPYLLFGHSMGSFAARLYAMSFGYELSGLALCGTGNIPAVAGLLESPLGFIVSKIGEDKEFTSMFDISGKFTSLQFDGETGDTLAWLSRNRQNREIYALDPLCGHALTFGGAKTLAMLCVKACESGWAEKLPLGLSVLVISGAKDPVGSNGRGVLAVVSQLEKAGNEPTVILYPGDRHEILNEDDRELVYNDVLKWAYESINN